MNIAVIYDSKSGNTKMAAEWIAEAMNEVSEVNAEAFSIQSADEKFINQRFLRYVSHFLK